MNQNSKIERAARLSVAPMMEWTDRYCRLFHRALSREALLYTEMIAAAAVVRGSRARLLDFDPDERPLALQLGGSDPAELAEAVRIAADWGYDEINLNVGCPSDRVQSGAFGACLMRDPGLVARCMDAMIAASVRVGGPAITVKCRLGVDEQDVAQTLPRFLDAIAAVGVVRLTIHARKAWLKGLSPKENRDVPPLDYALVRRMKAERPELAITLNGGLDTLEAAADAGALGLDGAEPVASDGVALDGAMFGRAAYHDPWAILGRADSRVFGVLDPADDPASALRAFLPTVERKLSEGARLVQVSRHMLGLFAGRPGARAWRRRLSEDAREPGSGVALIEAALDDIEAAAAVAA